MTIKLNILRIKENNIIKEIFTVSPDINYCFDTKRSIYNKLREQRNKYSIHNLGYKLININYFEKSIIYEFEYDNLTIPKINEIIDIKYSPITGKKYCTKCLNYLKGYCLIKGFKITKKSFYKCLYWMESECI